MRFLTLAVVFLFLATALPGQTAEEKGFVPLFNGRDLQGWQIIGGKPEGWTVKDGILSTKAAQGGWLMTDREYSDFELKLEYRVTKKGNSGVALRAPLRSVGATPAYTGMEIQILDDATHPGLKPTQYNGSIYDLVPPSKAPAKGPGEWNELHLVAHGRQIKVAINGVTVVDANLDKYKDRLKEDPAKKLRAHPGIQNTRGYLGLQSYAGEGVSFRNIRLKDLSKR